MKSQSSSEKSEALKIVNKKLIVVENDTERF